MAVDRNVKNIELMWSRTNGSFNTTDGRFRKLRLSETWTVVCGKDCTFTDIYYQTRGMSGIDSGIPMPKIGTQHREIPRAMCKDIKPTRLSPVYWQIEVTYEGEVGPEDDPRKSNPLNDPPDIMWSKVDSEEPIDEDRNGKAIATKCGEKYDGVTMTISDLVVTVKRNFLTINLSKTHEYLHSVNEDRWLGFAPGTAHLVAFSANHIIAEEIEGLKYWEVNAAVQFRYPWRTSAKDVWKKRIRHEGYYRFVDTPNGKKVVRTIDEAKEPSVRPKLLDKNGYQLFDEDAEAHWDDWEIYKPMNYNLMGLL